MTVGDNVALLIRLQYVDY